MGTFVSLLQTVAWSLAGITAISTALNAWRRRDRHRLDIFAFSAALIAAKVSGGPLGPTIATVASSGRFFLGYLLLRLIRHFREVPPVLLNGVLVVALAATVSIPLSRGASQYALDTPLAIGLAGLFALGGVFFVAEARRTGGVTRRRLLFAATGTWLMFVMFLLDGLANVLPSFDGVSNIVRMLQYFGLIAYFFAFSTPRFLKQTWQRAEHASYLSRTAERDAEERGLKAADDLFDATSRSVGNALAIVALRPAPDAAFLVVQAATAPALVNLTIVLRDNLIGRAVAGGVAAMGSVDDSEREITERLKRFGTQVLVAPIGSDAHNWGAVLVVQRRGSLFPEDDLVLLARLGRYAGTALDHALLISERRDRERRHADRRLREVEARLALMLDSIKDYAMLIIDDGGRVVSWQSGAEHVFGYTRAEMEDEPAAALYNIEVSELRTLLDDARRRGFAEREGWCRRRDGDKFVGATVIRPLTGEDAPGGFVAVTRDVTAQRDLEDRLRQSQKMEAVGQLAGGIAHDFNNQLTAILGYSEVLSRELSPDDERRQSVGQIEKAAERAAGLTRQLLAFSRRQLIEPVVINLSQLVTELLPMLRRVIGEHIQIQHDDIVHALRVRGDRSQVEQIIVNLAVNARDAMPDGGRLTIRTASIWLDETAAGREVSPGPFALLEVVDTGMGMDPATKARIFEPFFTTKEFGRGTGLGLATVYGIVQQMGGLIRVASQSGHGSTFRFYFPEVHAQEAVNIAAAPQDLPRGDQTLLLVEDESSVRTFLQHALERHGYRVIAAEHQASALALVQAYVDPIDLVITDVVMPGGTGPELVQALEDIRPGMPTLYISGFADPVLGQYGFPKASHFLQKPFSAADLLLRVNQILTG